MTTRSTNRTLLDTTTRGQGIPWEDEEIHLVMMLGSASRWSPDVLWALNTTVIIIVVGIVISRSSWSRRHLAVPTRWDMSAFDVYTMRHRHWLSWSRQQPQHQGCREGASMLAANVGRWRCTLPHQYHSERQWARGVEQRAATTAVAESVLVAARRHRNQTI